MPRRCCVPGCTSNYNSQTEYTPAFLFPKNEERRNIWVKAINRKDFVPGSSAVICIKHFDDRFIIKQDEIPQKDGSVLIVERKKFMLKEDAFPTIFENQPKYLTRALPKERKAPVQRAEEIERREEENFLQWCLKDKIQNFDDIKSSLHSKISNPWLINIQDHHAFLYKIEVIDCPQITIVVKILENLSVNLYFKNTQIDVKSILGFVLGSDLQLDKWTKLDSVLSFLNSFEFEDTTVDVKLRCVIQTLTESGEEITDAVESKKINFLSNQLLLMISNQPRYTSESILWAAKFYFTYPAAYMMVRKSGMLCLPHQSYLRNLTSTLSICSKDSYTSTHFSYLKRKISQLKSHETVVNLLLDEIYISPTLDYKGGNVVGMADNSAVVDVASTVQTFMISSVFSKNKDVVALIPVKNLTSDDLLPYTLQVMSMLNSCGYKILSVISDNHRVNRNTFTDMCNGILTSNIEGLYEENEKIFFLFDTPHLIKSIRNNWFNQKETNQTFFYPDPDELESINVASVLHLKQIYDAEKFSTVRSAPKLTRKVLFPSSVERQNVNHALGLFHETNSVALQQYSEQYGSDFLKTKVFLEHVQKWWKIVNCKHPKKGKRLRDEYSDPITGPNHQNIIFLQNFYQWLCKWEEISLLPQKEKLKRSLPEKGGMLTSETMFALKHTTKSLIDVSTYVFEKFKVDYILLGKFQTDSLEASFGQFRQMNGGNYHISYRQIIESDKKLKVLSLIKLCSNSVGEFHLKSLKYSDDSSCDMESKSPEELKDVIYLADSIDISLTTKPVLIFIAGYVGFKAHSTLKCSDCVSTLILQDKLDCEFDPEVCKYIQLIDRGGLKWPTQFTFTVVITAYQIFQALISEKYEGEFLKFKNLKAIVIQLTMEKIVLSNSVNVNMCPCGIPSDFLVRNCLSVIVNILLNNYCKARNEKLVKKKSNKRKLATLLPSASKQ